MKSTIQVPSIVLPTIWTFGNEVEDIDDLLCHVSIDIPTEYLHEKQIHILATEIVTAGVPGNLLCWIELSPYPSTISTAYWAAIGGGGGVNTVTLLPIIPPATPYLEVATGGNLTRHTILIPWSIHSPYARIVVQTPVSASIATAQWAVQALVSAKTP